MAGGTWLSQNKMRPGAYINFKAVPKGGMTVGDRGIVAMGLPLSWGERGKFIEVLSSDLLDGASVAKVGFDAFTPADDVNKKLVQALSYAYKALVFNMNSGGSKATATEGELTITAKCEGVLGNDIIVTISKEGALFVVKTFFQGAEVDTQKVGSISELEGNDFVEWGGSGELAESAGIPLSGGEDGSEDASSYTKLLGQLKTAKWQTFACFSSEVAIKKNVCDFIDEQRDGEGRYVQAVVCDYDGADSEGIINSISGAVIDGVEYSPVDFVAIVAGMTAGANFNESNTAREVKGATQIIGELSDAQINEALSAGKFLLSASTSGKVRVEQDINSLHTYTKTRNYNFSKNRVIRTLDEIGTTTKVTWEDTYMGKVDNNATGRNLFRSDLIQYGNELQRLGGIQEFDGAKDVETSQGNNLDSVTVTWAVKPVDSMEKLYLDVNVRS